MSHAIQQLLNQGLRYGDHCTIVPAGGPRRKVRLNRSAWEILPEGDETGSCPAIRLPDVPRHSFKWRLELVKVGAGEGEERFLLRSLDGRPFVLNGQCAKEAFVEDRDTLSPEGLGRLEFTGAPVRDAICAPGTPQVLEDENLMRSRLPVLLQGETGTGKGFLAREIHRRSARPGQFVAVNVQAFNPALVESELFGHRKGAFTGAHADRRGAIMQAKGGTLFLDEVDSLPLDLQTKLLLFLDDRIFRPVGSDREETADVRLLFASGRKLSQLVAQRLMRADLFFRIGQGLTLDLLPLRERPEDIRRHCQIYGLENDVSVSARLQDFYMTLPWPGNVRQLLGHLSAKRIRSRTRKLDFDEHDEALLVMSSDLSAPGFPDGEVRLMEDIKRDYALWALRKCQGEMNSAARRLGVNRKTLRTWVRDQ